MKTTFLFLLFLLLILAFLALLLLLLCLCLLLLLLVQIWSCVGVEAQKELVPGAARKRRRRPARAAVETPEARREAAAARTEALEPHFPRPGSPSSQVLENQQGPDGLRQQEEGAEVEPVAEVLAQNRRPAVLLSSKWLLWSW